MDYSQKQQDLKTASEIRQRLFNETGKDYFHIEDLEELKRIAKSFYLVY